MQPAAWARCQAEVRATFHKAWRDLVVVLESDEEQGLPEFGVDDEDNDQDEDADGGACVTEPTSRGNDEFLPFQPEELSEQLTQLPETVVISVETLAARAGVRKSASDGAEGGTNWPPQDPQSEPGPSSGSVCAGCDALGRPPEPRERVRAESDVLCQCAAVHRACPIVAAASLVARPE